MGMSGPSQGGGMMSEINVTPMVDVMLVLLIIFIITAPLLTHAVKVELPHASTQASPEKPETITLSVNGEGAMYWNADLVTEADLGARLATAAQQQPQPELHLRVDREARYQRIAEIMAAAHNAGVSKIGFVTDPNGAPAWTTPAALGR